MFIVDADDKREVAAEPLVGSLPLLALQVREECLWFVCWHAFTVALGACEDEVTAIASGA